MRDIDAFLETIGVTSTHVSYAIGAIERLEPDGVALDVEGSHQLYR